MGFVQASQEYDGRRLFRWYADTSAGSKVGWSESEDAFRVRLESHGLRVLAVRAAGSPLSDRAGF